MGGRKQGFLLVKNKKKFIGSILTYIGGCPSLSLGQQRILIYSIRRKLEVKRPVVGVSPFNYG